MQPFCRQVVAICRQAMQIRGKLLNLKMEAKNKVLGLIKSLELH